MSELALHLSRALHLIALCLAPGALQPDPRPASPEGAGAFALVILGIVFYLVLRVGGRVPAILLGAAIALALAASSLQKAEPLAASIPLVAAWVWGSCGAVLATVAWRSGRLRWHRAPATLALAVVSIGAIVVGRWVTSTGRSTDSIWAEALRRDPTHEAALEHVTGQLFAEKKLGEIIALCDRCLDRKADDCVCLELRTRALVSQGSDGTPLRLRGLAEHCGAHGSAQALLAHAHALVGDVTGTQECVDKARSLGVTDPQLGYVLALAFERSGNFASAETEAERAVLAGAGRDALLLLAAVRIARGDLERAGESLDSLLRKDPKDVEALYNRALVADRRADYNGARQGYLAVLQQAPKHADARYNLTLLTLRAGASNEARHHATRFAEAAPDDPRRKALEAAVGIQH